MDCACTYFPNIIEGRCQNIVNVILPWGIEKADGESMSCSFVRDNLVARHRAVVRDVTSRAIGRPIEFTKPTDRRKSLDTSGVSQRGSMISVDLAGDAESASSSLCRLLACHLPREPLRSASRPAVSQTSDNQWMPTADDRSSFWLHISIFPFEWSRKRCCKTAAEASCRQV